MNEEKKQEMADLVTNEVRGFLKKKDVGHFEALLFVFLTADVMLDYICSLDENILKGLHNKVIQGHPAELYAFVFTSDLNMTIKYAKQKAGFYDA